MAQCVLIDMFCFYRIGARRRRRRRRRKEAAVVDGGGAQREAIQSGVVLKSKCW